MDEPITIEITKEQSLFLFKMIEPSAVLRPTWVKLYEAMREKGWC
jgi:hypothetical protein